MSARRRQPAYVALPGPSDSLERQRRALALRDAVPWRYVPVTLFVEPTLTDAEREELDRVFGAEHDDDDEPEDHR